MNHSHEAVLIQWTSYSEAGIARPVGSSWHLSLGLKYQVMQGTGMAAKYSQSALSRRREAWRAIGY